jgi:17beta-estradiol 17-dehydrogenase / very-long-chain 3-oxoacyl-CoA reductase
LAKKGFNLVLISRTQQKLDKVASDIHEKYSSAEIKTIAFDFTNANLADYESMIFSVLNQLEVGVLSWFYLYFSYVCEDNRGFRK